MRLCGRETKDRERGGGERKRGREREKGRERERERESGERGKAMRERERLERRGRENDHIPILHAIPCSQVAMHKVSLAEIVHAIGHLL